MAFLGRKKLTDFGPLVLEGQDMIEQTAGVHAGWGLGSGGSWDLDQTTGIITWTLADLVATAPAQILGSWVKQDKRFQWAWANPSILPGMKEQSEQVRAWGEANGATMLTTPTLKADADQANTLVAMAFRITEATGYYANADAPTVTFMTFGTVSITRADGTTDTVSISVE